MKKPISNKYVAARLTYQREDQVYSPNCWFPQHSLKIKKKIQEMKWPSARAGKGTKRKQFHFNGYPHYFCSDTHHAPLDGCWGRRGDKIKWRFSIVYWRQISLDENAKEGKFRVSKIRKCVEDFRTLESCVSLGLIENETLVHLSLLLNKFISMLQCSLYFIMYRRPCLF